MNKKNSLIKSNKCNCDICGASIADSDPLNCSFCGFTRKKITEDMVVRITSHEFDPIIIEKLKSYFPGQEINIPPYEERMTDVEIIYSDNELIFEENINVFFKNRNKSLKTGGLLYINVPVSRFYKVPKTHKNQINFFKEKNIMFLLEQHGFHMLWRKSRFSTDLRIIAKKV